MRHHNKVALLLRPPNIGHTVTTQRKPRFRLCAFGDCDGDFTSIDARYGQLCTQCRPTLPDNLPAIRQTASRQLEINGMYRHGYMVAPAMLDVALEVLGTGGSELAGRFDLSLQLL